MCVHKASKPSVVELAFARTRNGDIYHRNRRFGVTRIYTSTAKRIWHSGNKHIPIFEKGTAKFFGFGLGQVPTRFIAINTIANIGKLNQSHAPLRVLVLAFDPIAIDE